MSGFTLNTNKYRYLSVVVPRVRVWVNNATTSCSVGSSHKLQQLDGRRASADPAHVNARSRKYLRWFLRVNTRLQLCYFFVCLLLKVFKWILITEKIRIIKFKLNIQKYFHAFLLKVTKVT